MTRLTGATRLKLVLIGTLCLVVCVGFACCTTSSCTRIGAVANPPTPPAAPDAPSSWREVVSEQIDPATFKNVSIDWASGSVDVRVVPDEETDGMVRLRELVSGNVPEDRYVGYAVENEWLNIDYAKSSSFLLFGCAVFGTKHLDLAIPESAVGNLGDFYLDAASGEYALEGLSLNAMNIDLASGTIRANDIEASALQANMASGHLTLSGCINGAASVTMASGDLLMTLQEPAPHGIDLECASGTACLELPSQTGFRAAVEKTSGSFTCDFPTTQNDSTYAHGDEACRLNISMFSGNVTVRPSA